MGLLDGIKSFVNRGKAEENTLIISSDQYLATYTQKVASINSFESSLENLTDDQLKAKTLEFKTRISNGESLDSLLPEAFAVVREASWRVLELRHYDVQVRKPIIFTISYQFSANDCSKQCTFYFS